MKKLKEENISKSYNEILKLIKTLLNITFKRELTDIELKNIIENLHYYLEGIE